MTKEQKNDKEQIWLIVFLLLPVVLFMNLGEHFTDNGLIKVLYGGLFGGLGGLIGLGLSRFSNSKSTLTKVLILSAFLITSFVIIRILHVNFSTDKSIAIDDSGLITCQVCGYKTLTKDNKFCDECLVELTKLEMKNEGYSSIDEYIKEEQISFFCPDSLADTIDFYRPKVSENGYEKDLNWVPIVPQDTVLKFNKEFIEYLMANPIEININMDSLKK